MYNRLQLYMNKWMAGCILHLFLFFLSLSITLSKIDAIQPTYFGKVQAQGFLIRVASEPRYSKGLFRFEAQVLRAFVGKGFKPVRGKLQVAVKANEKSTIRYGDELLIPVKLSEIEPPYNPFEFDYKKYLSHQGIEKQAFLNANQFKIVGRQKGNPLISYSLKVRKQLVAGFSEYIKDKQAAALASTLILGYKAELSSEIITAYSKTGTMHVLSVSGMHVLLVFSIFTFLLSFLDRNVWLRVFKVTLIIALIWFYAMLTGFSSAVCRAAVMCTIYVIGKTFNKRTNSYNTLAASAFLLLIYNPFFLLDAGFQLSYLAVAGLIYLYPKVKHLFFFKNRIFDTIWSWTAVSVAAQLATLPLSLYYFHQFPVYFLLSNLFIILPVQLIMYAGIGFLALFSFSQVIPQDFLEAIGEVLNSCIQWTNDGLITIQNLSFSSLNFYPYGAFYYLFFFAAALLLLISIQIRKKKILFLSLSLLILIVSYTSYEQIKRSGEEQVIIYSLRKNRAIAFFSKGQCCLYTDLQPNDKTFAFSIQPSVSAFASRINVVNSSSHANVDSAYNHFLVLGGWRLMIWDRFWKKKDFRKRVKVNAVLITDNPWIKLQKLNEDVEFSLVLIDATNKEYRINQWVQQARELGIKYYVLKQNPAFRIVLKS